MASFRDELRTVLSLVNLSNYLTGLQQAQQGNQAAAQAIAQLQGQLTGIGRALFLVGQGLGIQAGQWLLLTTALYGARSAFREVRHIIDESLQDFQKYNEALLRTTFLFSAMGSPVGIGRIQAFARERSAATGISEQDTLSLAARARQTGFGPTTISRIVPLLQDVQTSGLTSAGNALDIINKLLHQEGRGRGSLGAINEAATVLRLDPRFFTGGQQHDLQEIMRQLTARVGGLTDALAPTVSGVLQRNQELLHSSMARLGLLIGAELVPILTIVNRSLLGFNRAVDFFVSHIGTPSSPQGQFVRNLDEFLQHAGPIGLGLHLGVTGPLRALQEQGRLDEQGKKQDEANKHLAAIEGNTQNIASAIFLSIFGSASAFTRQAASFRNLQAAINFRA